MNRVVAAGMRNHFSLFLMRVFRELHPEAPPLALAWYVKALCHGLINACDTPGSRLAIMIPPRHLKSIAASVALPAFLLGRDPSLKIMVATYSQDLARLHASQCRAIMQTAWYLNLFPRARIADDANRILEFVTTAAGGRKAVSVGGSTTGFGANLIIVDDCLKADDARSAAAREEVKNWYDGVLATRLNSTSEDVIISISQRLHEDDLPAHLLAKGFSQLCLPAIAERDEFVPIGPDLWHHRKVGSVLDRPGQTRESLESLRRDLGPQVFAAQYQQNPVAPEGNLIRLEWFGMFEEVQDRASYYRVVQSWDTGLSDLPTADFSVCTTWGYRDGHWDLLDVTRQRFAYPDLKRAVISLRRKWQPDVVIIEDAGTGKALWQEFRMTREFRPVMSRPYADKETRLIGVTGQLEAGLCRLPVEAPWLNAFRDELRAFPFGRKDDQVDSMTQFLDYYIVRGRGLLRQRDPRGGRPLFADRPGSRNEIHLS